MSLVVQNLSFSFGAKQVLHNISFQCGDQERLCLVGPNGCGKSTLLNLLGGRLERPNTCSITGADDKVDLGGDTIAELFEHACAPHYARLARLDEVLAELGENPDDDRLSAEYDQLLARLEPAWALDTTISTTLAGMGLDYEQSQSLHTLSPGERARVELAALLVAAPHDLILDEPTNHLDDTAREYLIGVLHSWPGAVVLASHDRDFIEQVATGILDMDTRVWSPRGDGTGVHKCNGKYSDYLLAKAQASEELERRYQQQRKEKARLVQHQKDSEQIHHSNRKFRFVDENRSALKFYGDKVQKASTRRVNDDSRRLDQLAQVEVRKPRDESVTFQFPPVKPELVRVGDRLLHAGDQLLITGANGVGKSTLLRHVSKEHEVVLIPQELPAPGDPLIPAQAWEKGLGELGKGYLHPRFWSTPLGQLSAGNQRRAQLACALNQSPGVLLFDEPTNYLDLGAIESLEQAFAQWEGTLVITTHDRWLINRWEEELQSRRYRMHLKR